MRNQPATPGTEWTILRLLKWTSDYFASYGIESPRIEAELLLAHALDLRRIDLYLRYDQPLHRQELAKFKPLVQRRADREPAAYILGTKEFWSMELQVNRQVLIPRPETECLVEAVVDFMTTEASPVPRRVLDLGTGSGAIALALASQARGHIYFASDFSQQVVGIARGNAIQHRLKEKIHFFCSDWFSALKDRRLCFDIIVSNPPYIKTAVIQTLQPEIWRYEPISALDGGDNGLYCLKKIIRDGVHYLRPQGRIFLEMGHDQKTALQGMIEQTNAYDQVVFTKDYSGYDRVVQLRKK